MTEPKEISYSDFGGDPPDLDDTITPDDYHSDTSRISKSGLDKIAITPAHYYEAYLNPNRKERTATPAMKVGSAVHCAVFEPLEFDKRYIVEPYCDKRTTKGKADYAAFELMLQTLPAGAEGISQADRDNCMRIRDAVRSHPMAATMLAAGFAERKIEFTDPETGVLCKCKPDWYDTNNGLIPDLKTTEDASIEGFGKSAWNYRYHIQAPFYSDGMIQAGYEVNGFVFIAVEKYPPYAVQCFSVPRDIMEMGRMRYIEELEIYKRCKERNEWPAYSPQIKALELPSWAFKRV